MRASRDLEARVAALEEAKSIAVGDLPLSGIQRFLEAAWSPDVAAFLAQRFLELEPARSVATPADVAPGEENVQVVQHGLGREPTVVLGGLSGSGSFTWTWTADTARLAVAFRNHGTRPGQAVLHYVVGV